MRFGPLLIAFILCHVSAWSQGIPWFRNYTSEEYGAHNQNFDIDNINKLKDDCSNCQHEINRSLSD